MNDVLAADLTQHSLLAGLVLAGGEGRRLGGRDKALLRIDGVTLLDRALTMLAAVPVHQVVVVGPERALEQPQVPVRFTRESPAGGGPAAGLVAGVEALTDRPSAHTAAWVAVLAVDMAWVEVSTILRLQQAASSAPGLAGAFLTDPDGRRHLAGVLSLEALAGLLTGSGTGTDWSMRRLLEPLQLAGVPAVGREAHDVDTPHDLARLSSNQG